LVLVEVLVSPTASPCAYSSRRELIAGLVISRSPAPAHHNRRQQQLSSECCHQPPSTLNDDDDAPPHSPPHTLPLLLYRHQHQHQLVIPSNHHHQNNRTTAFATTAAHPKTISRSRICRLSLVSHRQRSQRRLAHLISPHPDSAYCIAHPRQLSSLLAAHSPCFSTLCGRSLLSFAACRLPVLTQLALA
jgi:hypothetical protein